MTTSEKRPPVNKNQPNVMTEKAINNNYVSPPH